VSAGLFEKGKENEKIVVLDADLSAATKTSSTKTTAKKTK